MSLLPLLILALMLLGICLFVLYGSWSVVLFWQLRQLLRQPPAAGDKAQKRRLGQEKALRLLLLSARRWLGRALLLLLIPVAAALFSF
ncbi:hypothetical protein [Thalassolituus hydrocarboniclasticus]|uniref:Uncharacterized protein n=1 Tax=Thalassolituus hydrocarboniclasticus TaxID=2742796 RepID=A0ABY6AD02_9GAMM|nr:hypothetical protein [Thalassolituus hydrocarboniclasticus]UXD88490.1 hypothetical protein HUF19_14105 [Thalassolituus hydrocarboniclasticus]